MLTKRQVDILYFASCPTWQRTAERVRQVVSEAGLEGSVLVRLVPVDTDDDVRRLRFLGSPTVRVDGEDVDPDARGAEHIGLQCRLYPGEGRVEGVPPVAWIRRALGLEAEAEHATAGCAECACGGDACP
ncbi:MAG TPA: hypothetical protein VFS43_20825 [Polyangiaceae bacterium]|nr:hypothetical protein [Polyangiaceae bacterium]